MKLPAENTATGSWIKKDELKNGDHVKVVSEAKMEMGQNGEQLVAKVLVSGTKEPGNVSINKATRRALVESFGDDTVNWVDKILTVHLERMMIGGKRVIGLFLIPEGYEVTEDAGGYIVVSRIGGSIPNTNVPYPDEEVKAEDIPF
jgi:hypothetical protein